MDYPATWKGLFKKKMTRKQFLLYSGASILWVTGIISLMRNWSSPLGLNDLPRRKPDPPVRGFGGGTYGGSKAKQAKEKEG